MPVETGVSGPAVGAVVGPDGEDLAKEATADRSADAAESLAGAVDGTAIRVVSADPPPTFAAAPPTATEAPAVRIVGDGLDRNSEPILRVKGEDGQIVVAVQGDGSGDPQDTEPWYMKTVRDEGGGVMAAHTIATEETAQAQLAELADDATTADVQEVRDRLPSALIGDRLPVDGSGVVQPVSATSLPLPDGAAEEATAQAIEDAVDGLEGGQATANTYLSSIDGKTPVLGPALVVASVPIVFATDHPPVGSELYVGMQSLSNTNPVPVRGIVPSRTATGAATPASTGQIGANGVGALLYWQCLFVGTGNTRFLLFFDANSTDTLGNSFLIPCPFPVGAALDNTQQRWAYPLSFTRGLRWAISSTAATYTPLAQNAIVFAQWVML